MYWPFDSKNHPCIYQLWGDWRRVWHEEVLCGYRFGIPACCVIWYLIAVYLCLLTRKDAAILPLVFGEDGWEEFLRLDYYRCPLCRFHGVEVEVGWS